MGLLLRDACTNLGRYILLFSLSISFLSSSTLGLKELQGYLALKTPIISQLRSIHYVIADAPEIFSYSLTLPAAIKPSGTGIVKS